MSALRKSTAWPSGNAAFLADEGVAMKILSQQTRLHSKIALAAEFATVDSGLELDTAVISHKTCRLSSGSQLAMKPVSIF
jgi:hypothetical protein